MGVRHAIVDNTSLGKWLESNIGEATFGDLNMPFAAVASGARSGKVHIFKEGSVAQAVRASTAIPITKSINMSKLFLRLEVN